MCVGMQKFMCLTLLNAQAFQFNHFSDHIYTNLSVLFKASMPEMFIVMSSILSKRKKIVFNLFVWAFIPLMLSADVCVLLICQCERDCSGGGLSDKKG